MCGVSSMQFDKMLSADRWLETAGIICQDETARLLTCVLEACEHAENLLRG